METKNIEGIAKGARCCKTKKLKVYGFNVPMLNIPIEHRPYPWGEHRLVVATTSWKSVAEISGRDYNFLRNYGSVTGNAEEIQACLERPGVLFYEHNKCFYPIDKTK